MSSKKPKLLIIKLGGAAITDKTKEFFAREDAILKIIAEIGDITSMKLIIHGAGSFAHNLARDYDLALGRSEKVDETEQIWGISKIRSSMQRLHQLILDASEAVQMSTFSLPISSLMISEGPDQHQEFFTTPIHQALQKGFVPISFGDMVFDASEAGYRVVSGDRIIKMFSEELSSSYDIEVIFGSNVDGLFDNDPKVEGAKLITNIKIEEIDDYMHVAGQSAGVDVTGGMIGKLKQIAELSEFVSKISLINITISGRLSSYLSGKFVPSTIIE